MSAAAQCRSLGAADPLPMFGQTGRGYPRTVQNADGTLVTIYYCNDHAAGERYPAATLWNPP